MGDVLDDLGRAAAARLQRTGLHCSFHHLDVTSQHEWAAAVHSALERTGRLDILVNNAGIVRTRPLMTESLEHWNAAFAVNTTGPLIGIQQVVPAMRAGSGGSIINIASTYGLVGAADYVTYCASKAALIGMTKVAAIELAPDGIRVNAICPGGVRTAMNQDNPRGGVIERTPMGRRAEVSEISGAVVYLASEDASFTNGAVLAVDGGYLAR
jgi:NAD(P)-dependent dehydrogenase (short-subunit alcohol dehydrogenase family)